MTTVETFHCDEAPVFSNLSQLKVINYGSKLEAYRMAFVNTNIDKSWPCVQQALRKKLFSLRIVHVSTCKNTEFMRLSSQPRISTHPLGRKS